jgi:hypothetical protein
MKNLKIWLQIETFQEKQTSMYSNNRLKVVNAMRLKKSELSETQEKEEIMFNSDCKGVLLN